MLKRRNRVYRRIAVALTVALLAGQSHAFVLAEEGDTPQTEITGEADTSTSDNSNVADGGNADNGSGENAGGTEQGGGNGGTDNQNPEDNENKGNQQGDGDEQDSCVCGTKCAADAVNTDCPVCVMDYIACTGKADDAGNNGSESGDTENNDPENGGQDNTNEQMQCICETACTEEAVNADCPVCAADYANCAKNAGGGVNLSADAVLLEMALASVMDEEAGIAALADEGVEAYAVGDTFEYTYEGQILKYNVIKEDGDSREVAVMQGNNAISGEVTIPESVTKGSVTYRVTSIVLYAFADCSSLTSIEIPNSVTSIGDYAFRQCVNLSSIEIPNSVTSIGPWAFYNCNNLDTLQIVISSNQKYQFPTVGQDAFTGLPDSKVRNDIIIKKGTGLTDDDLKAADVASAFNEAEGADGLNDSLWYGWSYKGLPEVKDTHKVTITVQKDDTPWTTTTGCDRTFALTKDGGTTLVTNLDAVEAGEYEIVDVTDSGNKLNTGVTVTVADADVLSTDPVNYYTVAFCYLDDDGNEQTYGDSTDWKPQTILKTVGRVAEPATNPTKADHTFDKWVTAPNGETTFAFGTTEITAPGTKIYAKWTQTTVPTHKVTITVQKDDTPWTTDCDRTFALTKDSGTTLVTNLDAVEAGNYEIVDITDSGNKLKTGVTVTVADADVPSTDPVNYYTVAFCYLDDDGNEQTYGDSTDWKPQIVLKDKGRVAEPATNPTKADHTFGKWVTAPDGDDAFAFGTTPITATGTKIYAKWTENTVTTYYTVTFYDGTTPYGADTPQSPQRVASGQQALRPDDPTESKDPDKAGWEFAGWKTADGGSTSYDFDTPVTGDTNIYASWVEKTVVDSLRIQATATEGGTIAPKGEIIVSKGGERTFTITPDEGNKIKAVTVDGKDVTAELKNTLARAQAGARYYTFTNIVQNHTIHAEFERDGGSSGGGGGGDNPDPGGDNPGGGGDNPNPGGGSGGGGGGDNPDSGNDDDNKKPDGGNSGGGDHSNHDGGGNNGGGTSPDGGNGTGNTANADTGNGAGNGQTVVGTVASSAQAGNGVIAVPADGNTTSDGSKAAGGSTSGATGAAGNGKEPKTGDASYLEVYATLAMIAGLTYLLLYVMEESRGMSEREKEAFVAAFIRWGKKGGAFRKCCAMAAIFCLLAYYHIIGKNVGGNALREEHLGQAF